MRIGLFFIRHKNFGRSLPAENSLSAFDPRVLDSIPADAPQKFTETAKSEVT